MRRPKRPRLDHPETLDQVLAQVGETRFRRGKLPFSARTWHAAVGGRISERTRPISLEAGVLTLLVPSSSWAHELSLLSDAVVARLVALDIPVTGIRFRVGPVDPPARPAERLVSQQIPPPAPLPSELAAALSSVDDLELREAIAVAARVNLAWQKNAARTTASAAPGGVRVPRAAETESVAPDSKSQGAPRKVDDERGRKR